MPNLSALDARNLIVTYLETPAAAIYNSNPANATDGTRANSDVAGGGITFPANFADPTTPVASTNAVASSYASVIQTFIQKYSAIRLCTFQQITSGASPTVATYQRYCMLNVVPSYHTAIPTSGTIQTGSGLTAGSIASYTDVVNYLSTTGQTIITNNINLGAGRTFNFCHSSCHTSCHTSGGRNRR